MNFDTHHQQCLEKLIWATEQLQVKVERTQLSKIARLIVQTMTGPWRYFHSTKHIFEVGGYRDGIEVLAALFHDLVYVQVDGSVNFNLTYYLAPFIEEDRGDLFVREQNECGHDSTFEMVVAVFGFVPGEKLSHLAGQNEFLSAVVAGKVLEQFLSHSLIFQIVACIEATIPFRSKSALGLSPSEILHERLLSMNNQFNLQLTEEEIIQTVKRSVRLANRDVGSFAHPSAAVFLSNTWSLLPETNHDLKKSGSYTVRDYRKALQKMLQFMNFLKPELVFRQFQGEPDEQTYRDMVEKARKNLKVGRLYLESKLVAIAIIEALSLRLGQEVSLASMIGELPDHGIYVGSLGNPYPDISQPFQPENHIESEVLEVLEQGRSDSATYDLRTSPLTTFMVKYAGFDEMRQMWKRSHEFFQGTISSENFLDSCNAELTAIITSEVKKILENRLAALCRPRQQ